MSDWDNLFFRYSIKGGEVFKTYVKPIFCLLILLIPVISEAATINVKVGDNIADVINSARRSDIILLEKGIHVCTQTIDFRGYNFTLAYTTGDNADPEECVIDFNGHQGFTFKTHEINTSKVINLTIRGAKAENGGAVYCEGASPEFSHCIFDSNEATKTGGAVHINNGMPFFDSCIFRNNIANDGGAVYIENVPNSDVFEWGFYECRFNNNTARNEGGGFYITDAFPPFIIKNWVYENTAKNKGGGIFIHGSTDFQMENLNIYKNKSENGAGIYLDQAQSFKLKNCNIYQNTASGDGGGIYVNESQYPVFENALILENIAAIDGGAICMKNTHTPGLANVLMSKNENRSQKGGALLFSECSDVEIQFCTLGSNIANSNSGIVYFENTPATILNSILWNDGYEEIVSSGFESITVAYSDVQMDANNVFNGSGNINQQPLFQDDPSHFDIDYIKTYYHLKETSPCINAGMTTYSVTQNAYSMTYINYLDYHGINRNKQGSSFDMGAFEYEFTPGWITASPTSGRAILEVNFICTSANTTQSYSFTAFFGDGSEPVTNTTGIFTHEYDHGVFDAYCRITNKKNKEDYSETDSVQINVASLKWIFNTGDIIDSSPAIGSDGTVYVGSDNGYLFAIQPNGHEKWRFKSGARITSSPTVDTVNNVERVIFGSEDQYVYAVRADNGKKIWRFKTYGEVYSSPAVDLEKNVYIGSCDHNLYAIRSDGTRKWSFFTRDMVISSPSIMYYTSRYGDTTSLVFIGSHDDHLYALDLDTGILQWSVDVGGDIFGSPAIGDDGTIYVAACFVLGASANNKLLALDREGKKKWEYSMWRGAYASPVVYADIHSQLTVGMIFLGSYDNNFYGLGYDGIEKWAFPTRSDPGVKLANIVSTAAAGQYGTIFIGSENHNIYAINYEKGKVMWSYTTNAPVYSSPALSDDGVLYVGSFDHNLYAIYTNVQGLSSNSPWPMYRQNNRHHGRIELKENKMPPTILETYPKANATNVPARVPITLRMTFSKEMKKGSIDLFLESAMSNTPISNDMITYDVINLDNEDRTRVTVVSFKPITQTVSESDTQYTATTLDYDTRYKIKLSSTAEDLDGIKIQGDWTWIFYSEPKNPDNYGDSLGMRGCFIDLIGY